MGGFLTESNDNDRARLGLIRSHPISPVSLAPGEVGDLLQPVLRSAPIDPRPRRGVTIDQHLRRKAAPSGIEDNVNDRRRSRPLPTGQANQTAGPGQAPRIPRSGVSGNAGTGTSATGFTRGPLAPGDGSLPPARPNPSGDQGSARTTPARRDSASRPLAPPSGSAQQSPAYADASANSVAWALREAQQRGHLTSANLPTASALGTPADSNRAGQPAVGTVSVDLHRNGPQPLVQPGFEAAGVGRAPGEFYPAEPGGGFRVGEQVQQLPSNDRPVNKRRRAKRAR